MEINWIDVLLVFLVLFGAFAGWLRGFVLSALDLVRWAVGLLCGLWLYELLARLLEPVTNLTETWSFPLAFLILFFAASISVGWFGRRLLKCLPKDFHQSRVNRLFGILPGSFNGLLTAAIASALLLAAPFDDNRLTEMTDNSSLANRFGAAAEQVEVIFQPIFSRAVEDIVNRQMSPVRTESNESVELPFKVENVKPLPELEAKMLELVNQERAKENLKPLAADPELTEVARRHSADMFARGYFAHQTPENLSPFDRMRSAKVRFLTAGENLALAPTLDIAHTGLMNSPGHRANILKPQFGRLGIGVVDGGRRGLMITQNFRN